MVFAGGRKSAGQVLVEMPNSIERGDVDAAVLHCAVRVQQQRPRSAHPGVGHGLAQRRQPAGGKSGVVVQKKQQTAAGDPRAGIAALGKAHIFGHAHGRKQLAKQGPAQGFKFCGGGVGGMVVHHYHLQMFTGGMLRKRTQAGFCHVPEVPDRNNHRNARSFHHYNFL